MKRLLYLIAILGLLLQPGILMIPATVKADAPASPLSQEGDPPIGPEPSPIAGEPEPPFPEQDGGIPIDPDAPYPVPGDPDAQIPTLEDGTPIDPDAPGPLPEDLDTPPPTQDGGDTPLDPDPGPLPGYQDPPFPIPYNRPGYPSKMGVDIRADLARTNQPWALSFNQLPEIEQQQALDYSTSLDPFASNYTLLNWDQLAVVTTWRNGGSNQQHFRTFKSSTRNPDGTFSWLNPPNAVADVYTGHNGFGQTQAADLNSDGVDEIVSVVGGVMQVSNMSEKRFMMGAPAIASPYPGGTWQFVRGYDDQLWLLRAASWEQLGGTLASSPTAFSPEEGRVDVLMLDTTGAIARCTLNGPGGICAWDALAEIGSLPEGAYAGTPVMTGTSANSLDIFARSSYNVLWHRAWRGGWLDWENLGYITSAPGAAAAADGSIHVVAKGIDNGIWHTWRANDVTAWSAWENLGGAVLFDPTIVSPAAQTLDVFVVGTDHILYRKSFVNGGWAANWAGFESTTTDASPAAAVVRGSEKVQMLYRLNTGAGLVSTTRDTPAADWQGFSFGPGLGAFSSRYTIANYGKLSLGHFLPNSRTQMINAHIAAGKLLLDLYEFAGGFYPKPIQLDIEVPVDEPVGGSYNLQSAVGDFYGSGVESLALQVYSGSNAHLYVVQLAGSGAIDKRLHTITIGGTSGRSTMLTSGDYNGDVEKVADDEMAVFNCVYNSTQCWLGIYNIAQENSTSGYTITMAAGKILPWNFSYAFASASANFVAESPGDPIKDEIAYNGVRQWDNWWEYYRMESRIIKLTNGSTIEEVANSYKEVMILDHAMNFENFAPYRVRITGADLDRDGQAELGTFYERGDKGLYSSHQKGLLYYKYEAGALNGKGSWFNDEDPDTDIVSAELVAGNFAGEGLRVAKPSYRVIGNIGNLVAQINTPPKITSGGQVLNPNSQAVVSLSETSTQEISVEAKSHWNLDSEISATIGDEEESHLKATLTGSVGQDFSKVNGSSQTFTRTETFTSDQKDILLYATTDYQLFEYLITDGSTNNQSNMTVTWPKKNTFTVTSKTATTCEVLFNPGHDINNPLSYASVEFDLPGYTAEKKVLSGSYTSEINTDFDLALSSAADEARSSSTNWSVGAEVEGAYSNPAFTISASLKGEYGEETTATQKTTTGKDITIHGTLQPIGSNYQHTIKPYLYWNEQGTLVLDYVIIPGSTPWWNTGGGWNKQDLAFVRPWKDEPCGQVQGQANISPEITFSDSTPLSGDPVTATARVRNYSITDAANVIVRFYQGDPAKGGNQIACDEGSLAKSVDHRKYTDFTCTFTAAGFGEQRIYAVADPGNAIAERIESNNKAYAILSVALPSSASGSDPGRMNEYEGTLVKLEPAVDRTTSVFIPYRGIPDYVVSTFKLTQKNPLGRTFEFEALKMNEEGVWMVQPRSFGTRLNPSHFYPPALVRITYTDEELSTGLINEGSMSLYYWDANTNAWITEAACGPAYRDPAHNVLLAPVCRTGTYTLASSALPNHILLPAVRR